MEYTTDISCFSYACSSCGDELVNKLKHTNKLLLPQSVLYSLQNSIDNFESPLFFKLTNKSNEFYQVCGVHEFSAPPGVIHAPYYVMNTLGIREGETINIELVNPPEGSFIKIRPHKTEFIELPNPKELLEKILSRDYQVLIEGHTIQLYDTNSDKVYEIDIVETKPASIIKIIDINLEVDFEQPLDYVEPVKKVKDISQNVNDYSKMNYDMNRFPGKGYILGSE
jgi:ubiquitin fusion degradation protein 1|tara:strand:- start:926 stop:1600 length:675 start_codon:yes stop_codon:yes gene_type:complete